MATLADIRHQYPQYNDMSDSQLADAMHAKFYSDMPKDQFYGKIGMPLEGFDEAGFTSGPIEAPAAPPSGGSSFLHGLQLGTQAVGRGVADVATMPFDLAAGAQNLVTRGINYVTGANIPQATPASQLLDKGIDALGVPTATPETPNERLLYNMERYGTQALATGGAGAMAAPARAASLAAGGASKVGDAFIRPYITNASRTVVGDVAGGAGAGAGINYVDEHHIGEGTPYEPLVQGLAALAGGTAGVGAAGMGELAGRGVASAGRKVADVFSGGNPSGLPVDPVTLKPYSRSEVDAAAVRAQSPASNPTTAATSIGENAATFRQNGQPVPTSGLISNDVGLQGAENAARTKNPTPFVENDNKLRSAATGIVDSFVDPGANLEAPKAAARRRVDMQTEVAQRGVDQATGQGRGIDMARQQEGAPLTAVANSGAKANASRQLDKAVVEDTYLPDRAQKNRLYNEAVPPGTPVDTSAMAAKAGTVQQGVEALPPSLQSGVADNAVLSDLKDTQSLPYSAATQTRMALADAEKQARAAGQFGKADTTRAVRQPLQEALDTANPEAAANYRENFAPKYRAGPGDEMTQFTQAVDRDSTRSKTPPSATAGRFLSSPEKTQALQRVLATSPSAEQGNAAVRDYLRSDFASSALNPDGTVNPIRAKAWADNNADVLSQFPQVQKEFGDITARARRGVGLSEESKAALKTAQQNLKATEIDIDRSAAGTLLREDPRDVANRLISSGKYGSEKEMTDVVNVVKNDPQALRGWKAAVSEVLQNKVTGLAKLSEGDTQSFRVELGRMDKMFKDNEALLSKVYSPEEMNQLRQAHKLLEPLKALNVKATAGSQTTDKLTSLINTIEVPIRAVKGALEGGSIMRRLRVLASALPNNQASVDRLVASMWFNPEVAQHLLTKDVSSAAGAPASRRVRLLIGAAAGSRASGPSD